MADAGTNLPGDQRILLGGVFANQQNGFRLVELLHGEQRITSVLAERGDQAGVIRGAVVVNVVGAKGGPRQALQQIAFFIRSAVRTDEADAIGSARIVSSL